MPRVKTVKAFPNYTLEIVFTDGLSGTVDLSPRLFGPAFEPLNDPELFLQASVDDFGAITWPCGADLAPDALHSRLASSQPTLVSP